MAQEHVCSGGEAEGLCDLYEQLRGTVLEASGLRGRIYGLGVLMRQGMRAWMTACGEHMRLETASDVAVSKVASCLPGPMQEELTRAMACMVWPHIKKEVEEHGDKLQGQRKPSETNRLPLRPAVNGSASV